MSVRISSTCRPNRIDRYDVMLASAARLLGSSPKPSASRRSIGAATTFGGSKRSRPGPDDLATREGMYSHHDWLAATRSGCAGSDLPPYLIVLCQPCHENSWLSPMQTNGNHARASWMSGSAMWPRYTAR